uniref:Cystathionine gamma-lyase n=1 Tax=Steinernema glaseri TaxID=37863 RepID=A0A1I8ARD6_9BILA
MQDCDYQNTRLTHLGRDTSVSAGFVNVPVCRGSTILADNLEQWAQRKEPGNPYASYGRFTNPTLQTLTQAVAELEGGFQASLFPSGLAACTHALLGMLEVGDHLLIPDSVYGPVQFYEPSLAEGIASLIRPNTKVVYVESPGSATFEIQDIPAIARCAHAPFEHGVDVSIQAATKYLTGHSDALLGIATANERAWPLLRRAAHDFGQTAGPDDAFLALRGMRTLGVHLAPVWHRSVLGWVREPGFAHGYAQAQWANLVRGRAVVAAACGVGGAPALAAGSGAGSGRGLCA